MSGIFPRVLLGLAMLSSVLSVPVVATTAPPSLVVTIDSPRAGEPAFGTVPFTVGMTIESSSPAPSHQSLEALVESIRFMVDGRLVTEIGAPPWTVNVDVGTDNAEHSFEVEVVASGGEIRRAVLVTPAVAIDLVVELGLRQLYLTVTRQGLPALDLPQSAIRILDDGVEQKIVTFERGDVPFTAVLLLDASLSMKGQRLEAALAGARSFFSGMAGLDQVKLLLFSDRIAHDTPFTSFPEVLEAGLASVEARGGTSINDHLYLALKMLEARQGRRLVILLSDGVDLTSGLEMAEVLQVAERSRSQIFWIRLGSPRQGESHFSAWRDADGHRRELELLERTVGRSGGRIVTLGSIDQSPAAFAEILEEIRGQYVLGYYPSRRNGDGRWHKTRVRVSGGYRARAKAGYFDY